MRTLVQWGPSEQQWGTLHDYSQLICQALSDAASDRRRGPATMQSDKVLIVLGPHSDRVPIVLDTLLTHYVIIAWGPATMQRK